MPLNRNRFYLILFIACLAGYIWLFYIRVPRFGTDEEIEGVCLFRRVTGIPCPSCGSTRAVDALLHGHVFRSLQLNPFGIIVALIMTVTPVWIVTDVLRKSNSLYRSYQWTEKTLRRRWLAFLLIALVLANWIWNIAKGY